MAVTDAPIGVSLDFAAAGSYKYPHIYRTKDGAPIRAWNNRPYQGSIREAREAFLKLASRGCNLDNLTTLENATEKQIIFVKRLNGLFEAADGGFCKLRGAP